MELLEFMNKALELCNVKETKDIGNALMETVLNHNEDLYNKYLEIVGDTDWLQALWQYYEAEQVKELANKIEKEMKKIAQPFPNNARYWDNCWKAVYRNDNGLKSFDIQKCLKACKNKSNLFYRLVINDWNNLCYVYEKVEVKSNNAPAKQEKSEAEKQYGRAKRFINKAAIDHYNLRLEFVKSLVNKSKIKDCEKICLDTLINSCDDYGYINGSYNDTKTYEKLGMYEDYFDREEFANHKEQFPAGHIFAITYAHLHDSETLNCFASYYSSSKSNFFTARKHLEGIYDFLEALGYETSDEEKSILNGTHPIYDVNLGADFLAELKKRK